MRSKADNLEVVEALWKAVYDHDYDAVGALIAEDGLYQDVPTPDYGAVGPEAVAARLRSGFEPVDRHVHHLRRVVCDGNIVVTEHQEDWHFRTGEVVELPFVSVIEVDDDGKIALWRDYWDLNTLMQNAPQWWLDHIAQQTYPGSRDKRSALE